MLSSWYAVSEQSQASSIDIDYESLSKLLADAFALKCRWIRIITTPFNHHLMLWMIGVARPYCEADL